MKKLLLSLTILLSSAVGHTAIYDSGGPGTFTCQVGSDTVTYTVVETNQAWVHYRISEFEINGKRADLSCAQYIHGGIRIGCGVNVTISQSQCSKSLSSLVR